MTNKSQALLDQQDLADRLLKDARQWLQLQTFDASSAVRITAGQQLAYNSHGEISSLKTANTALVSAWRDGPLVFELAPLAERETDGERQGSLHILKYHYQKPLATPYYWLNQQFGSFDLYRTSIDATGPLTKDDT